MRSREAWEEEAGNWLAWARTPGFDAYWHYRDSFFDRIVPPPGRLTLEVGCGEGRVTRDLAARGHRVVALDASPTLVRHAADVTVDRGAAPAAYALADAAALPLGEPRFDVAVAYNALMDFDDLQGAVAEVARVCLPGAVLCVCITHPMLDTGGFEGEGDDARYVLRGDYFGRKPFDATATAGGLTMRFRGWSAPLQDYVAAITGAGFLIDALAEPTPAPGPSRYQPWRRFPMFLHLRAVRRPRPERDPTPGGPPRR